MVALVAAAACRFDGSGLAPDDGGAVAVDGGGADADAGPGAGLAPGDVRLVYGRRDATTMHSQRYRAGVEAWSADAPGPPLLGAPEWLVAEVSPAAGAIELVATLVRGTGTGTLTMLRRAGAGWVAEWSEAIPGEHDVRAFDVAFSASGDALAVYADGTATPVYRARTGGVWSAPQPLPLDDGGRDAPVEWIELSPRVGGDEIALAYSDAERRLIVMLWDGAAWDTDTAALLTEDLKANPLSMKVSNRAFDVAFETVSGDVLAAWGSNTGLDFWYATYRRAAGMWSPAATVPNTLQGQAHQVDLAADPSSDRVALGLFDLGDGTERLAVGMWNGTQWIEAREVDSQIRDFNDTALGDSPGAVAWIGRTGVAVCVYADDEAGTIEWARWSAATGWQMQEDIVFPGKGFTESVRIAASADGDRVTVAMSDAQSRLWAATYDGTDWVLAGDALVEPLASDDSVPFDLAARAP
jgi:hypothetical protein